MPRTTRKDGGCESILARCEAALAAGERSIAARETQLLAREQALAVQAELATLTHAQLREANERMVSATIRAQTMLEDAQSTTAHMTHVARHDVLTGLPNRALLADRLAQAIAFARRHGKRVALMYVDLDQFKAINDSLGHAVGDQLLQSVARRLQDNVRHSDTVCRQGGDEFVVLLAEVDALRDADLTAAKLVEAMAQAHLIGGHTLYVTASIGVSVYPDNGNDAEALIRNADTAMYHAKSSGRNKHQLFTSEMNLRAMARRSVELALRNALEQRQLMLALPAQGKLRVGPW